MYTDDPFTLYGDTDDRRQRYSHVQSPHCVLLIVWEQYDVWFEPEGTYQHYPTIVARFGDSPEQYFEGHGLDIIHRIDDQQQLTTYLSLADTALVEGTMIALQCGLCHYDYSEDSDE